MFGISGLEFFTILLIAIFIIRPKEFPEIARFIIKLGHKTKNLINKVKKDLIRIGDEIGLNAIKKDLENEINQETKLLQEDITTIIDIYGNEHQINNLQEIREDKNKDELEKEILKLNKKNKENNLINKKQTTP